MIADSTPPVSQSYAARADEDYIGAPWIYSSGPLPQVWVMHGAGTSQAAAIIQALNWRILTEGCLAFYDRVGGTFQASGQDPFEVESELVSFFSPQLGPPTSITVLSAIPGEPFTFLGDVLPDSGLE